MQSISICLASYNGEKYIGKQIESIIPQLLPGDEIVVSDDGSTDGTIAILNEFAPWVVLVDKTRAGGVVKNFERALASAKNPIIVMCDQDDYWLPGRLDAVRRGLQECDCLVLNGIVVDGDLQTKNLTVLDLVGFSRGFFRNFRRNGYVGCCMAFNSEVLKAALPFPAGVVWHDWFIGLLAELMFTVKVNPECSFLFRRHDSNTSNTGHRTINGAFEIISMRLRIARAVLVAATNYGVKRLRRMHRASSLLG